MHNCWTSSPMPTRHGLESSNHPWPFHGPSVLVVPDRVVVGSQAVTSRIRIFTGIAPEREPLGGPSSVRGLGGGNLVDHRCRAPAWCPQEGDRVYLIDSLEE